MAVAAAKEPHARKNTGCPDVAFYGLHYPARPSVDEPARKRMRPIGTIYELSDPRFESLTTRLLPIDQNKKLN